MQRNVERAEQFARGRCGLHRRAVDYYRELIAAEAVYRGGFRRGGNELLGNVSQHLVAKWVTERVVNVFEVVKVEKHKTGAA